MPERTSGTGWAEPSELVGVGLLHVPLPPVAVGGVRPRSRSSRRSSTPCRRRRWCRVPDVGRRASAAVTCRSGLDLDTQVVDRPGRTGTFEQHELERRVLDGEVRVAVANLGGSRWPDRGVEHLADVEVDGRRCCTRTRRRAGSSTLSRYASCSNRMVLDREQRGKWAWFRLRPERLAEVGGALVNKG
jgi:hypothetical protein